MGINDDLHVNGAPQLHQPGVLCLFVWWTFHFVYNSAIIRTRSWTTHVKRSKHEKVGVQLLHEMCAVILHILHLLHKSKYVRHTELQICNARVKRTLGCVYMISFD